MKSFWNNLPQPFFVLAPMEQVTDVVFRHVIQKAGAPDVFYTEFANATGWVHAGSRGIGGRLVKTNDEHPIVAQIWGGEPGDLEQFAKHCAGLGYDGIDINMGCPAKSAVKSGGAALIRQPDLAAQAIAAAKKAGLPVSVKTRLGYSNVDEWQDWLGHLLQQDIAVLTVHLRTKKEMSKVPAHYELIPEIKKLRDDIAPHTLLVINGDIKDRAEGEKLAEQYGIDGVMIGRGVFTNPFCFAKTQTSPQLSSDTAPSRPFPSPPALKPGLTVVPGASFGSVSRKSAMATAGSRSALAPTPSRSVEALIHRRSELDSEHADKVMAHGLNQVQTDDTSEPERELRSLQDSEGPGVEPKGSSDETIGSDATALARERYFEGNEGRKREDEVAEKVARGEAWDGAVLGDSSIRERKHQLIDLLYYHLNLYDQYAEQTKRPYETLKRFFKIYIRDFDGASDLREKLMHTKNANEARELLKTIE